MTPKKKAEQLIESYAPIMSNEDWKEKAKQCALIAVDEIQRIYYRLTDEYKYWEQVKTEIQNL